MISENDDFAKFLAEQRAMFHILPDSLKIHLFLILPKFETQGY